MTQRPTFDVAVVMRRETIANRWQPHRWVLHDVVPHEPSFGSEPRLLLDDGHEQRWLHPGFSVQLHRDDAEGYYLNATTDAPCWFVLWRMEEEPSVAAEPEGKVAAIYKAIARKVAVKIGEKAKDFSAKMPKIVIQNT